VAVQQPCNYPVRAIVIKSDPATTGCDKVFLTYKTAFRIVHRKSNFLSIQFNYQKKSGHILNQNYFSTRFSYDEKRDAVWKEIADYIRRKEHTEEAVVLELGAGYCCFINNIECKEKYAIDLNPEAGKYAAKGVRFFLSSSENMVMLPDRSVDIVFASNFFEHLGREALMATFVEIRRVLKNSGRLILIQPNYKYCTKDYFDDYTHLSVFTHISMKDFLECQGFVVEKCFAKFLPFSMKSRFPKTQFLVRLYLKLPFKLFAKQMYLSARKLEI
jgi:SAM-dependent methyltransferase